MQILRLCSIFLALFCGISISWLEYRASRCASESMNLSTSPISRLHFEGEFEYRDAKILHGKQPLNLWAKEQSLQFESALCPVLLGTLKGLVLRTHQGKRIDVSTE